jgi:hypothetical protein
VTTHGRVVARPGASTIRHRHLTWSLVLAFVLSLGLAGPAAATPDTGDRLPPAGPGTLRTGPPQLTVTYEVAASGAVQADLGAFATTAQSILQDARGWSLGGSVAISPVASGGDFTLILASPSVVANAAPVCSSAYSCRVGDRVYINDRNWRQATPAWNATGAPLWLYREYLVNHEVGHFLGYGHEDCATAGTPAPVMQQQSISLQGCEPNGWPLDHERQRFADDRGVPVHDWVFTDVLAGYVHRDAIHALAERGTIEGRADGSFRPDATVTRAQLASYLAREFALEARQPHGFTDVGTSGTHVDAIAAVAEAGIVAGYDDGTFRPQRATSRGQMATVLARAYDLSAEDPTSFPDVPEDFVHAPGIAAVAEAGIAQGFPDGDFRPLTPVTRGQLTSFVDRAAS